MKRWDPTNFHLDLRDLLEPSSSQPVVSFTNIDFSCCIYNPLQFHPYGINGRLVLGLLGNITPSTVGSLPFLVATPDTSGTSRETLPDPKPIPHENWLFIYFNF